MKLGSLTFSLSRDKKQTPPQGQVAVIKGSDLLGLMGVSQGNPDVVYAELGLNYLHEQEIKDAHYRNCIRIRKNSITARELVVEPASEDPIDQDAAAFLEWNLEHIKGTIKADIRQCADAISKGYSVMEIVWAQCTDGDWAGRWYIEELRSMPPECFEFRTDEHGKIKSDGFRNISDGAWDGTPVDINKFVVWSFDPLYENPYGRGLGATCLWYMWFKQNGLKFWLVYVEKFGTPLTKVEMPAGALPAHEQAADAIMNAMQTATGIRVPEGFKIEFLEATRRGEGGYRYLLDYCDKMISLAVLGQTLTSDVGEKGSGSFALGKVHSDILDDKIVEADVDDIEDVLGEQFTHRLMAYNFNVQKDPRIKLQAPKAHAQLDAPTLEIILDVAPDEDPIPFSWIKDRFGIPAAKEGEPVLQRRAKVSMPPGDDNIPPTPPGKTDPNQSDTFTWGQQFSQGHDDWTVQFTERTGERHEDVLRQAVAEANPEIHEAVEKYIAEIAESGVFESKSLEAVAALKPDFSAVRDIAYKLMYFASLDGITDAQRLLWHKGWRPKQEVAGGTIFNDDSTFLEFQDATGLLEPEDAIKWFESLQAVPRDVYDLGYLNGNGFTIAWTQEASAVRLAQGHVIEALQNGWGVQEFRAALLRDKDFMSAYEANGQSNAHFETIFRTNMNAAYNRGRVDFYNDPLVGDYVVAYRYNAILDSRVRPEHAAMDGREFAKDSYIWNEWMPPNGYNCRCYIDPVSAAEWAGESKRPAYVQVGDKKMAVEPDKGFGRRVGTDVVPVRLPEPEPAGITALRR